MLKLLALLNVTAYVMAADIHVSSTSCSPQKACDFVTALNALKPNEPATLSLLCTPDEKCTISGTQIGGEKAGLAAHVAMAHVLLQNRVEYNKRPPFGDGGGLLNIGSGVFSGTNVTFRNGSTTNYGGGCVNHEGGTFACTDCVFDKCSAGGVGGGVYSDPDFALSGGLDLVRPTFTGCTCGGSGKPCGSGCWCDSLDVSKCAGCLCKKGISGPGGQVSFCDSN